MTTKNQSSPTWTRDPTRHRASKTRPALSNPVSSLIVQFLNLPYNTFNVLRMYAKIRSVYASVDACSETLEKYKADGMVDGFSEELLGSILSGAVLAVFDILLFGVL